MELANVFLLVYFASMGMVKTDQCGHLVAQQKEVPVLSEARLYYYGTDFHSLWRRSSGGSYTEVPKRDYEEVVSTTHPLSVLILIRSQFSYSGTYRVLCRSGHYSTETELVIKAFPPSPPVFGNLESFPSCNICVSGWADSSLSVACSTWNGTQTITMEILKNNVKFPDISFTTPQIGETQGQVTFTAGTADHGGELLCRVRNDAGGPFITTARIYVKKNPDDPIIGETKPEEGAPAEITCTSNGGRPSPNVYFVYDVILSDLALTSYPLEGAYYVEAVLRRNFTRQDNLKKITCCSQVDQTSAKQCSTKSLIVSFPPRSAQLTKLHDISRGDALTSQVLRCTVGESFPSSAVQWTGLMGLNHNLSEPMSRQGKFGSVEKVQDVGLVLSPSDNGREITCKAINVQFPAARPSASYTLNVTYAPISAIRPEGNLTVRHGDNVIVTCDVDSNPPSTIGWYNGTDMMHEIHARELSSSLKMELRNVCFTTPMTFTCVAENGIGGSRRKTVLIAVTDKAYEPLAGSGDAGSSQGVVVGVVCSLGLLVLLGVVLAVVALRRRRKHEVRLQSNVVQIRIEERQPSLSPQLDEPVYNNINNMHAREVVEEEKRTEEQLVSNSRPETQNELVYAELELNDDVTKPRPVSKPANETEYVTIDFSKKASTSTEDSQLGNT